VRVELLYLDGCPSYGQLAPRLQQLVRDAGITDAVELRRVESDDAAQTERFPGSPTVRVNGCDIEPGADERDDFGLNCRLYRTKEGTHGVPPDEWITAALTRARVAETGDGHRGGRGGSVDLGQLAATIRAARPRFDPEAQQAALALYRLLAEGSPVDAAALAERVSLSAARVAQLFDSCPEVFRDEHGRAVAFGGLSLSETAHRFELGGRQLYTWCAWDTLFVPELLGRTARVTSACPTTREPVKLTVSPAGVERIAPAGAVLSMRAPTDCCAGDDLIAGFCRHVHFFASRQAAEQWLTGREDGLLLTINQGFELGRIAGHASRTAGGGPLPGRIRFAPSTTGWCRGSASRRLEA
jgi:alkylmercury lyase